MSGLVDQWVRDEVFYRERLDLGLERNDPVVRRRIAQKLEFIADGQAPDAPSDDGLQAWLDANADKYAQEPSYTTIVVVAGRSGDEMTRPSTGYRPSLTPIKRDGVKLRNDGATQLQGVPHESPAARGWKQVQPPHAQLHRRAR